MKKTSKRVLLYSIMFMTCSLFPHAHASLGTVVPLVTFDISGYHYVKIDDATDCGDYDHAFNSSVSGYTNQTDLYSSQTGHGVGSGGCHDGSPATNSLSDGDYWLTVETYTGGATYNILYYGYFSVSGGVPSIDNSYVPPPPLTTTHFERIVPYNGEATSTGMVTSAIYGYINSDDLAKAAGGKMVITSVMHRQNPLVNIPTVRQVDITTAGPFEVMGTTTVDTAGIYDQEWVISDGNGTQAWWQGIANFLGDITTLGQVKTPDAVIYTSTSTVFSIGTLSPEQQALFKQATDRTEYTASSSAAYDLTSCGLFASNFDMQTCIYSLVIPDSNGVHQIMDDAQNGFLTAAPWGYMVRIISLLNASTTSTSSLPVISYTFPSNFPTFGGMNFHFDPYTYMKQASTLINNDMVSNTDGKVYGRYLEVLSTCSS